LDSYLVEFRLHGSARTFVKELIYDVSKRFDVQGVTRNRVVPHVSIVGSFETTDERKVIHATEQCGNNFDLVSFSFNGFRSFETLNTGKQVLAVKIEPSTELEELRSSLIQKLVHCCALNEYDKGSYKPHATIAFKDIDDKFGAIKKFLETVAVPNVQHFVLRLTLLKNAKIVCEYDLFQHRLLTRHEALDRTVRKTTLQFLRQRLNHENGFSHDKPLIFSPSTRIFLISDLHLNHENIIRYCKRPFRSKNEMNEALVNNWNSTVRTSDLIFFLGDLAFGTNSRSIDYWLDKLKGKKVFIRGNHDTQPFTKALEAPNHYFIRYKEQSFMLTHNPIRPQYWNGWVIHGEKHNNNLEKYPFINKEEKTINVSVEVINYKPISLDRIISEINGYSFISALRQVFHRT
jgi:calcineurin-like phosphoesterase family protein